MICPKCGESNQDSAGECRQCFYKFRVGYGYGDISKRDPWALTRRIRNITGSKNARMPLIFYPCCYIHTLYCYPFNPAIISIKACILVKGEYKMRWFVIILIAAGLVVSGCSAKNEVKNETSGNNNKIGEVASTTDKLP